MNAAFWIKLYTDTFENPKISKLRRLPAGNDILLIWIMLLATAGKCNAGGLVQITEQIPFTSEDLADKFKFKENTIKFALKAFEEYDMIEIFEGGFIYIKNWSEYQSEDKLAEIRAKDRERKRVKRAEARALIAGTAAVPEDVHGNVHGQSEEASAECPSIEDKEKKREIDKEKRQEKIPFFPPPKKEREKETSPPQGTEVLIQKYFDPQNDMWINMTEEQFLDLCDRLIPDVLDQYLSVVESCERRGKRYTKKTHYQAILDMAAADGNLGKAKAIETSFEEILSECVLDDSLKARYRDCIQMREAIHSPMTAAALRLLIARVNDLEPDSVERQKKLLEDAILYNWKSVYPLRAQVTEQKPGFDLDEFFENACI